MRRRAGTCSWLLCTDCTTCVHVCQSGAHLEAVGWRAAAVMLLAVLLRCAGEVQELLAKAKAQMKAAEGGV